MIVKTLITALNDTHDNVWALVLIFLGVHVALHKDQNTGNALITLGAAVFQRSGRETTKTEGSK